MVDSFPVAACDNYRICRCHLYHGEEWRGYQASKKRFFYGLKIHLMITEHGQPVEFFLSPGSYSDTNALKVYFFDLPEGAKVTGDKAYTDYVIEDVMSEANVPFSPLRKKNSTRPVPPWVHYLMSSYRKMVETTGSLIERLLPKHIHAVTARGFEIKVALFVLACSINYLVRFKYSANGQHSQEDTPMVQLSLYTLELNREIVCHNVSLIFDYQKQRRRLGRIVFGSSGQILV